MPVTATGYTVTTAAEWAASITAQIEAALGRPVIDDSIEQQIVNVWANAAFDRDTALGTVWDAFSVWSAVGPALDRWFAGSPARRGAVASRYTFRATSTGGSITYPAGYVVQGGGSDGLARWTVVADTTVTASPTQVLFECAETGPVAMDSGSPTTLSIVTPLTGLAAVEYDPTDGDDYTIGRERETDAVYRARALSVRGAIRSSSYTGIRRRLLDIEWVEALALAQTTFGGVAAVNATVVPEPVGADRISEFAQALRVDAVAWGIETAGAETATVTLPDNGTVTARWDIGQDDPIPVAVTVVLSGVTLADVQTAIQQSIEGVVAALNVGGTLYYTAVYVAVASVPGVVGISSLTLDGVAANYVPSSTDLVTLSATPTVTT